MTLVVHNESNKVYEVVSSDENNYYLKRLGDAFEVRLSANRFYRRYRPISNEDVFNLLRPQLRRNQFLVVSPAGENDGEENAAQIEGGDGESTSVGILYSPNEIYNFDRIIVTDKVKQSVRQGVKKIELKDFIYETLNLKSIDPVAGKCILNFYGVPGTGKTMTAKAIANEFGKNLLQVDYSQIISKWVGDTAKHINECFEIATEHDAILFFDEADSLCSKRLDFQKEAVATSINQNRNVLMQNIDKFDGIIILATNLFKNFDPALLRRISQHIEFKLPTVDMREQILKLHVPEQVPLASDIDFTVIAEKSDGLSGGDIFSAVKEAVIRAVVRTVDDGHDKEDTVVAQNDFLSEIEKIKEAKSKLGNKGGLRKKIGFGDEEVSVDEQVEIDLDLEESATTTTR